MTSLNCDKVDIIVKYLILFLDGSWFPRNHPQNTVRKRFIIFASAKVCTEGGLGVNKSGLSDENNDDLNIF